MGKPKGLPKTGGRKAGTPNKKTSPLGDEIRDITLELVPRIREELKTMEGRDLVNAFIKLSEFEVPKKQAIAADVNTSSAQSTLEATLIALSS